MFPAPYAAYSHAPTRTGAQAVRYLQKVYTLFTAGVIFAIAGAMVALYAGTPVRVETGDGVIGLPPIVAWGMQHWIMMLVVYFGAFLAASFLRRRPGINLVALFGYTFVTGLFLAPTIFFAQVMASQGVTLDTHPVRDAFILTGGAFTGLTSYVLVTRKNFSFLGGALSAGLWVVLIAMLLGIFFHSAAFHLAIASVGVLLFCGYILYDTSRLLHDTREDDAVGAALRLFLDVVNLFLFLLRILSSSRR